MLPDYKPYKTPPDLGLVRVDRKIKFKGGRVSPICLPTPDVKDLPTESDPELKVYVAGWGKTAPGTGHPDGDAYCDTNEFGPAPHSICSFPFNFDGDTYDRCTKIPTPSYHHPVCKRFFKWANSEGLNLWGGQLGKSYLIKFWNATSQKRNEVSCYNEFPSNGWCGTCYDWRGKTTKRNEEGYCDDSQRRKYIY